MVGPHVKLRAFVVIGGSDKKRSQIMILGNDDPKGLTSVPAWGKPYWQDVFTGLMIVPRGLHEAWTVKSPPNYVERSHALLGMTVDQERVGDVMAAVRAIDPHAKSQGVDSYRVVGRGQSGILGAYAALFEPAIKEVIVIDPPKSHLEGPYFLNVLRVLDVPEALGLLAPLPLTIVGGDQKAFERTAEIYRAAGAADKLTFKKGTP